MDVDDLLRASERAKVRPARLHGRVFGVLCAFAALATACAPAGSRPARPPASTPLLADFTRYCLDARVEQGLAVAAAKSAGLDVQIVPPSANRAGVPMALWLHLTNGRAIAIGYGGEAKGPGGGGGGVLCQASDPKDDGASLKVLDDWLGPGHRLKTTGAVHEFQLRDGRAWPIDGDDPKALAASRATGNHYVLIALHLKTVTNLVLRRWRAPTR